MVRLLRSTWKGPQAKRYLRRAIKRSLQQSGAIGVREAKKRVPVRTGRLRGSIRLGNVRMRSDMISVELFADARAGAQSYAAVIELGLGNARIAKPFIEPGGDLMVRSLGRILARNVR